MDGGPEVLYGDELVVQEERAGVARCLEMLEDFTHTAAWRVPRLALEEQDRTIGLEDASSAPEEVELKAFHVALHEGHGPAPEVIGRVVVE
jgi:hypothetical protein